MTEAVGVLVSEGRRMWDGVADEWMVLEVCDNRVEGAEHPGKEQEFWLVCSGRCQIGKWIPW